MTDTPTPRTDALVEANRGKPCSQSVDCDFARTLERDLTACRAALRELVAVEAEAHKTFGGSLIQVQGHQREFAARLTIAWSAARAILQSDEGEGK